MRKYVVIAKVALVLALMASVAYALWPRPVPPERCSPEYRRFADNPHVGAVYLPRFQVNDTLTVAVTVLKALDSTGWVELSTAVGAHDDTVQYAVSGDAVWAWLAPKGKPGEPKDSVFSRNNFVAASYRLHTVSLFHIDCWDQLRALNRYNLEKNITKQPIK